jgi:hypothetical protein
MLDGLRILFPPIIQMFFSSFDMKASQCCGYEINFFFFRIRLWPKYRIRDPLKKDIRLFFIVFKAQDCLNFVLQNMAMI